MKERKKKGFQRQWAFTLRSRSTNVNGAGEKDEE